MGDDFMACVSAWAKDRLIDLPEVLGDMRKTVYFKMAKGQHRKSASEAVIWRLLDAAETCGHEPAGR